MRKRKQALPLAALLLAAAMLAGCGLWPPPGGNAAGASPPGVAPGGEAPATSAPEGTPPPLPVPDDGAQGLYRVPLHDQREWAVAPRYAVVDASGNELYRGGGLELLYDPLTGAAYAFATTRTERTGEADEYGSEDYQIYSQLYDAQGQLLADWAPGVYRAACNGWVVAASQDFRRYEIGQAGSSPMDYRCELRDMRSGEVKLDDIGSLALMEDGSFAAYNADGFVAGILDENMNALSGFPMPAQYAHLEAIKGGYIALTPYTEANPSEAVLLDASLRPRTAPGSYSYMSAVSGSDELLISDYAVDEVNTANCLLRAADGEVVYRCKVNESIVYCDWRVMILMEWRADRNNVYRMQDPQGNKLAEGYTMMDAMPEEWGGPADTFYAYSEDSGTLSLLGPSGGELRSVHCGAVDWISFVAGAGVLILNGTDTAAGQNIVWVLNRDLETVVKPGRYSQIYDQSYKAPQLLYAYQGDSHDLADILGPDGRVLLKNLRSAEIHDDKRVVARRGFEVGLMDFNGNWLWKTSAFTTLED